MAKRKKIYTSRVGGNPARPSNAYLMRFLDKPERYAAGKIAAWVEEALVKSAARRIAQTWQAKLAVAAELVEATAGGPDMVPGGKADDRPDSDFDPEALLQGVKVELEHTDDPQLAKEIAKDHLTESDEYYHDLAEMEAREKHEKGATAIDWGERLKRLAERHGKTVDEISRDVAERMQGYNGDINSLFKTAGEEREPEVDDHGSAPVNKMRPRAEIILFNKDGVYAIDKGDYLLLPGGGVDDGEQPRDAGIRETIEESNRHPINVSAAGIVESVWPENSGNEFWDESEFDGERTYFFTGLDAGEAGITHDDVEDFQLMPFEKIESRLQELVDDESQSWAKRNNEERLRLVRWAKQAVKSQDGTKPIKQAQDITEEEQSAAPAPVPTPANPTNAAVPLPTDMRRQAGDPSVKVQDFVEQLAYQQTGNKPPTVPQGGQVGAQGPVLGQQPTQQPPAAKLAQLPDGTILSQREEDERAQTGDYDENAQATALIAAAQNQPVAVASGNLGKGITTGAPPPESVIDPSEQKSAKLADAPSLKELQQHIMFTPDNKVIVRRLDNRRFALPVEGVGDPAPYEPDIVFVPEGGVPDKGIHGYKIGTRIGTSEGVPGGFEAVDPAEVLKQMYASMGLSVNRPYRQLDRARARAIARYMKKKMLEEKQNDPQV